MFNRIRTGGDCDLGDRVVLAAGVLLMLPVSILCIVAEILASAVVLLRRRWEDHRWKP